MSTEYDSYARGQLLASTDPRLVLWTEETTATGAEPHAGELQPDDPTSPDVAWHATGEQVGALTIRAQSGGYPGANATIAVLDGTTYLGWDPPLTPSAPELVAWSSSFSTAGARCHARATRLDDGRVVLVCEDTSTAGQTTLYVTVRSAAGVWGTLYELATLVQDDPAWPEVVVGGTAPRQVRIYALRHDDGAATSNVWMWETPADGTVDDGEWTLVSAGALEEQLAWSDEANTTPSRVRVALCAGHGLMLIQLRAGRVLQAATTADGYAWTTVSRAGDPAGTWGSITTPDLQRTTGGYVVAAFNTDSTLRTTTIGSPFIRLEDRVWREVYEPQPIASDVAIMPADGAVVWMLVPNNGAGGALVWQSADGGRTWYGAGGLAHSGNAGTDNARGAVLGFGTSSYAAYQGAAWVWLGTEALLVAETPRATGYAGCLLGLRLGGWTSLPLPMRGRAGLPVASRRAWSKVWWSGQHHTEAGYSSLVTGTITRAWTTLGGLQVVTDAGESLKWSWTPAGVKYGQASILARVTVASGTARLRLEVVKDGGGRFVARADITSTGITLYDDGAGTTIGASASVTGGIEVLLVVDDAAVRCWYRRWGGGDPIDWTSVASGNLAQQSGSTVAVEAWTLDSADVEWWWVASYHADSTDPANTVRGLPTAAWSSPRDLPGRELSTPVTTHNGVTVRPQGGPLRPGATWTSAADAYHHPSRLLVTQPGDMCRGWRSTGLDEEVIAWKLGEIDASTKHPIWALHWRGLASAIHVAWHDGTSWGSDIAVTLFELSTMTRFGRTLVPYDGAARSSATWVAEDELVGGYVVDTDGNARIITGNRAGHLQGTTSTTWVKAVIDIAADGTEVLTSSTWRIVWPEAVALLEAPITAKGVRVKVGATPAVAQSPTGYHGGVIGCLGPAQLLGLRHERATTEGTAPALEEVTAADGYDLRRARVARRREVTITWQPTHDFTGQLSDGSDVAADWIAAIDGGDPAYSQGEAGTTIRALVERWASDGRPVLYVPSYDRSAFVGGVQVLRTGQASGAVLGQLVHSWRREHVSGEEIGGAFWRLGDLVIRELPRLQDRTVVDVAELVVEEHLDGEV